MKPYPYACGAKAVAKNLSPFCKKWRPKFWGRLSEVWEDQYTDRLFGSRQQVANGWKDSPTQAKTGLEWATRPLRLPLAKK
jgi:hypothetical protein